MPARKPDKRSKDKARWGLLRTVIIFAAVAWVVRSLVVAPFSIPSGSMLPSLLVGDYLLVAKWPYGYSRHSFPLQFPPLDGRLLGRLPERGDVVVFRSQDTQGRDVIKRVIGLPGDRVEVRGGAVVLNGRPLDRRSAPPFAMPVSANSPCRPAPYAEPMPGNRCLYPALRETLPGGPSYLILDQVESGPGDDFAAIQVPAGHVFLMGDNRDDSLDSRFAPVEGGIGFVPLENIVGRAAVIFWSTDGSASYALPWTWFGALRAGRIGSGL